MTNEEFLRRLTKQLNGLPEDEIEHAVSFYREMILDRIEEGMSESEAVASVGEVEVLAESLAYAVPLLKLAANQLKRESSPQRGRLLIALAALLLPVFAVGVAAVILLLAFPGLAVLRSGADGIHLLAHALLDADSVRESWRMLALGSGKLAVGGGLLLLLSSLVIGGGRKLGGMVQTLNVALKTVLFRLVLKRDFAKIEEGTR